METQADEGTEEAQGHGAQDEEKEAIRLGSLLRDKMDSEQDRTAIKRQNTVISTFKREPYTITVKKKIFSIMGNILPTKQI